MIRAIFACDENWGIGKGGTLPWPHNSEDLKWFKECTMGGIVVMGRKTWESLPSKPLPNRKNIIVSDSITKAPTEVEILKTDIFNSRMNILKKENVWIIGGAQLIEGCLPLIDEFWFSRIRGSYECDTYLPRTAIELSYSMHESEIKQNGLYIEKWIKI